VGEWTLLNLLRSFGAINEEKSGGKMTTANDTSAIVEIKGERSWVRVDELQIDYRYQAPLNHPRAQDIANTFSWNLFQELTISERANGDLYIIDGHHRQIGLKLKAAMGDEDDHFTVAPATVFYGLTLEQEAAMFVALNTHRRMVMNPQVLYKANLAASDSATCEIQAVLDHWGQKISRQTGKTANNIAAVSALYWIRSMSGIDLMHRVFNVVIKSYPGDAYRWGAPLAASIAQFFFQYPEADDKRLIDRLIKSDARKLVTNIKDMYRDKWIVSITPGRECFIFREGESHRGPGTETPAGSALIKRLYNSNLRAGSLTRLE
jgi:hypothetical protein